MNTQPLLAANLPVDARIQVVGLGGVGSILSRYLALYLASLDRPLRLGLIDGDSFEPSNATRMFFAGCGNKASVAREDLLLRLADSQLAIIALEEYVTASNISRLLCNGDIILATVDNHATRKLINDFCAAQLEDFCLISGGNDGIETNGSSVRRGTYGNAQIYLRQAGVDLSPSLTRYHPEIAQPVDRHPADLSCTQLVGSVPQLLFTNLLVASAMLNSFWLYLCGALHYGELAFDVADGLMRPVPVPHQLHRAIRP